VSEKMDFSIIIPTWNRSELVDRLLESLYDERKTYSFGATEVLIIDSSEGREKETILSACKKYDATYIHGTDSVRQKRNLGIKSAKYPYIIFIDSDVRVKEGLLDNYASSYQNMPLQFKIGGILGLTVFEGPMTFWWKILSITPFVDAFSFAKKYPFHSWTIGNNVSFKKNVLEEIGMFEENLPYKLGGDDLELSYRVTKAGYMIGSAPDAVTYHSRNTWNNFSAIIDRAKRWGSMEVMICTIHPELYKLIIPKNYVIFCLALIIGGITCFITKSWIFLIGLIVWCLSINIVNYVIDGISNKFKNPIYYLLSKCIAGLYEFFRVKTSIQKKHLDVFLKGMLFNSFQIQAQLKNDAKRMGLLLLSFVLIYTCSFILVLFTKGVVI